MGKKREGGAVGEHLHARQLRRDGGDESSAAITSRAFVAVVVVGCVDAGRTTRANVGVEGGDMAKGVDAAEALVRANVLRSREGRLLIDESLIDESLIDESLARCSAEGRPADKGVAEERRGERSGRGSDCVRRRLLWGTDCASALS